LEVLLGAFAIAYSELETAVYTGTTTELALGHDVAAMKTLPAKERVLVFERDKWWPSERPRPKE
jgi:hypothetical protein